METSAYPSNRFAQGIYEAITQIKFGDGVKVIPVTTLEIAAQLRTSEIKSIDYRAKVTQEVGFASVFNGLAFDPENVRSQSIALYEDDEPVGVMTQVIAPRSWIEGQRYI